MIATLVPVLGRPARVDALVASWLEASDGGVLVFIVSPGDTAQEDACWQAALAHEAVTVMRLPARPAPGDFARKINYAYRNTTAPFLFQAADDVEFTPGWDVEALRVMEEEGVGVVGTNDEANPGVMRGDHSTHSLIRRAYVEECGAAADGPGVVFHEGYGHQYADNELVELARSRGCYAHAHAAVVRHRHPFWHTAEDDATYRRGRETVGQDRRLWSLRRRMWQPEGGRR